jgi:hypothetical protein
MIRYRIVKIEGDAAFCLVRVAPQVTVRLPIDNAPKGSRDEFENWLRTVFRKVRQSIRLRRRSRRGPRDRIDKRLVALINQNVDIPE